MAHRGGARRQETVNPRWRLASYTINAALTAAFSDSTGGRIGIITRSSAASTSAGARPDPSLPMRIAMGPPKSEAKSGWPLRGEAATTRHP